LPTRDRPLTDFGTARGPTAWAGGSVGHYSMIVSKGKHTAQAILSGES